MKLVIFLLAFYLLQYTAEAARDRLLSAVLMADARFVKKLLKEHKEGIISSNTEVFLDRVEKEHGRTSLLQCGFDPQVKKVEELDRNCTAITRMLYDAGANIHHRDKYGNTAISIAAMKGFSMVIEFLVDEGVPVNTFDRNGRTPLMIAATHGFYKAVQVLIGSGSHVWAQDKYGWSALHFAVRDMEDREVFRRTFDEVISAARQNTSILNLQDGDGRTPLMYSVLHSAVYAFDELLGAGADPRIVDNAGLSAYGMANSEYFKMGLAQASATFATREHEDWLTGQVKRKKKNREKEQCSLAP